MPNDTIYIPMNTVSDQTSEKLETETFKDVAKPAKLLQKRSSRQVDTQ